MVIPCTLPSPSDSPPYSSVGGGLGGLGGSCDVLFEVGPAGDSWTVPGRRALLAGRSDALALLLRHAGPTVRLPDVDKRGFEMLLRHLEGSTPTFPSVHTARCTLDVSCRFQCAALAEACVRHLDAQLCAGSVLEVFRDLAQWCSHAHSQEPSAPELGAEGMTQAGSVIQDRCSALLHNCLILIDTHCSDVISQESFETLSYQDISTIISRDTLALKSEYILYEHVLRWFRCQCKRLGNKPQTPQTRRELLGDLFFRVRFGLMDRAEFLAGPAQAGIFTSNEVNEILSIIDNPSQLITTGQFRNINVKRKASDAEPMYLSERTEPKNKKLKKSKGGKDSTLLNCLTVWTVLFD